MHQKIKILFISDSDLKSRGVYEHIKSKFDDSVVIYYPLSDSPNKDIQAIQSFIEENSEVHMIGISLGAFYSSYLSFVNKERDDLSFYLIDPTFKPRESHFYNSRFSEEIELIEDNFLNLFEIVSNSYLYFNEPIERGSLKFVEDRIYSSGKPFNVFIEKQNHSDGNINKVINQILENSVI